MPTKIAPAEKNEKVPVTIKLNDFLQKNRVVIVSVLAALLLVFVAFVTVTVLIERKNNVGVENTEKAIGEWINIRNGTDPAALAAGEDKVLADLANIAKKNGKSYASARAHIASAEIYFSRKDWKNAQAEYLAAAESAPKVYNTGINYYNAGVCADELGNSDEAVKYFTAASVAKDFALASRALFNIGRVEEQRGKTAEAIAAYEKLSSTYPDDKWTDLAKSRIITLQIK